MTADRWFGLAFVALGVGLALATMGIQAPFATLGDPGPKLLPYFLAAGLGVLGVLLVLRKRPASAEPAQTRDEAEAEAGFDRIAPPSVPVQLALAAALVAYVALFERLGFTLATFPFLFVAMVLLGPRTRRSVVVSAALAAALTLILGGFLAGVVGVPLPGVLVP